MLTMFQKRDDITPTYVMSRCFCLDANKSFLDLPSKVSFFGLSTLLYLPLSYKIFSLSLHFPEPGQQTITHDNYYLHAHSHLPVAVLNPSCPSQGLVGIWNINLPKSHPEGYDCYSPLLLHDSDNSLLRNTNTGT